MEILTVVQVKKFNKDLKIGTPIKVTYFPKTEHEQIDYGIVSKNLGDLLVYTTCRSEKMSQFEIEPSRVGYGIKIETGNWNFEGDK